jgi:phospholipid/cholesterol/gamma-HCH transport system substrate-binding protein
MPDRAKVRWSQLKVGIVGAAAFVILFVLVFLLTSSNGIFTHYDLIRTYMDDASGLTANTPVALNGINVGYLEAPKLTASANPKRRVELDMMIKSEYMKDVPANSVTSVTAANLLGGKFINIVRGDAKQTVQPGGELPAEQVQDIPELMAQMANVLQSFQTIVGRVDNLLAGVEEGKGNIGKLIKDEELYNRLNGIAAEGQQLLKDVRTGNGTLSKLIYDPALYNDIQAPLKRIDSMLADLQAGQGTAGKLLKDPALYDEAHRSLTEMHALLTDLNAGKGTAGKLVKDDQLYHHLDDLIARFNTTISKINSGQGTLGQIVVNPQLYDSLNSATREFQGLAKDIRANPKKFLSIRLTLF